jgi:hypothetical protein
MLPEKLAKYPRAFLGRDSNRCICELNWKLANCRQELALAPQSGVPLDNQFPGCVPADWNWHTIFEITRYSTKHVS